MPNIILPKKIVPITTTPERPLFFLAGPIRGGGDWQHAMAWELLQRVKDVQIACPSRWTAEHPLHEYFYEPFSQAPNRQLHWERHYMEQSSGLRGGHGCLIFWLPLESKESPHPGPEPYAMDTRREIGKYTAFMQTHGANLVVGGDKAFFGLSVILDELADAAGADTFEFHEDMGDLADAAIKVAQR
ncbi:hypothetical protein CO026_01655 [Candidatus Kaiserbacteria bacterium CG_4_9_14_0_2_um_filter_41_32]|uniref:Nucleoside 2-deoxyribosyltransferase n=1 Tax=Candidatus Kaiserbacteria bacterium CG_4_9_14_0_2_um_filter_41_32 TaxID=1974601 RepID=A0A2M8FEX6_9BACT|nr:MAG: hypothetical protein CO026_01655 [Candidatus Kaiserbacteria bacterium CG_4_9_14_0_2_um_filter_41_32]